MSLHSKIIGEGKPLLILHGFLGMGDNWKTLGNRFADKGFEVHLIDQRNHGRSFHDAKFSYQVMSDDLREYCLDRLLIDINIIGHSMGGKTAMQFAVNHESLIRKLVVADIAPKSYPQHHQDILKGLASLDFNELASRTEADKVLSSYIKDVGVRQFLLKNLYWVEKGRLGLRMNLAVLTETIEEVGRSLPEGSLFEKETLFIRGGNSGYVEDIDEILIKKHFPFAQLETLEGAGHWLHAENPDKFYQIVMDFL